MIQKRPFRHYCLANMSYWGSTLHNDVIKWMTAIAAWRMIRSKPLEHCAACDPQRCLMRGKDVKCTSYATKRMRNGLRIMWIECPLWQESELKTQRRQLSRRFLSRKGSLGKKRKRKRKRRKAMRRRAMRREMRKISRFQTMTQSTV